MKMSQNALNVKDLAGYIAENKFTEPPHSLYRRFRPLRVTRIVGRREEAVSPLV
jgi:hypothetical protein